MGFDPIYDAKQHIIGPGPFLDICFTTRRLALNGKTWLYPPDQTRYLLSRPDIVALGDVDDAAEGVGYHEDGILHVAEGELQLAGHSGTSAKTPRTAWLLGSCLGCMNPSTKNPRPVVASIVDSCKPPSVPG